MEALLGYCNWTLPGKLDHPRVTIPPARRHGHRFIFAELKILSLSEADSGVYTCTCLDQHARITNRSSFELQVRSTEAYVVVSKSTPSSVLFDPAVDPSPMFTVDYEVFIPNNRPQNTINVTWFHQRITVADGEIYQPYSFFHMTVPKRLNEKNPLQTGSTTAYIEGPIGDNASGQYIVNISAHDAHVVKVFNLSVITHPRIKVFLNETNGEFGSAKEVDSRFLEEDKNYNVYCVGEGYPTPNVTLDFSPCKGNSCDGNKFSVHDEENKKSERSPDETNVINFDYSTFTFQNAIIATTVARHSGTYYCSTKDKILSETLPYIVNDFPNDKNLPGINVNRVFPPSITPVVYSGSQLSLSCSVQKFMETLDRHWEFKPATGSMLNVKKYPQLNFTRQPETSGRSLKLFLNVSKLEFAHSGEYMCIWKFVDNGVDQERRASIGVTVVPSILPYVDPAFIYNQISANYSSEQSIYCAAMGAPEPSITWLKDGAALLPADGLSFSRDNKTLTFSRTVETDAGVYSCRMTNYAGTKEHNITLTVTTNRSAIKTGFIFLIILLVILCVAVAVLIGFVVYLKRRDVIRKRLLADLYRELMSSSGYKAQIDPKKPINEQIENLPYDFRYEIPQKFLKLGKILGEGQFGKVNEAFLSVPQQNDMVIVAAKQPKNGMDVEHQNALISELKMMIYIESHVNVLSLVGAVTKRMANGELYVLVEYCKLGSLGDYLKNHRPTFVNELVTHHDDNRRPSSDRYQDLVSLANQNESAGETEQLIENDGYLAPVNIKAVTGKSRSKYQGELDEQWSLELSQNKLSKTFVCTSDLLSYSYQVAHGMEYLASKNLIHRDLAIRNVLLTDNHVVKICDFGLARHDENYQIKKLDVPLPVRWMALESILDQEYTIKSDVWSFGILLWEIFTLGEMPYSGQQVDRSFIQWLKAGNRLEQPKHSPDEIFDLMKQCWSKNPKSRPDYKSCKDIIGEQLSVCCRRWYDDLRDLLNDTNSTANYASLRNSLIHFDEQTDEKTILLSKNVGSTECDRDKIKILPQGDVYYNCPASIAEEGTA